MAKTLKIGVGDLPAALDRFEAAFEKARAGKRVSPEHRLTFAGLPQLLRALTPARWRLLETLKSAGPTTVYELARVLQRDYKNVHTDCARLSTLGLIERQRDGKVAVPWDEISAALKLAA